MAVVAGVALVVGDGCTSVSGRRFCFCLGRTRTGIDGLERESDRRCTMMFCPKPLAVPELFESDSNEVALLQAVYSY